MKALLRALVLALMIARAIAHDEPTSFLDLRSGADGIAATLIASATDFAHDLPAIEPGMLLDPAVATAQRAALAAIVESRLHLTADGTPLLAELRTITTAPGKRDLHLEFHYAWPAAPAAFTVQSRLFPYDPRHRTFVNIY